MPRDVLVALLPVFTELFTDVPLGGLETAPIRWEINGYDLWYETLGRVGGAHHLVLLRAPDHTVAGLSEAGWDARAPSIVQQLTAVAPRDSQTHISVFIRQLLHNPTQKGIFC